MGGRVCIKVDNLPDGLAAVVRAQALGVNVAFVDEKIPRDPQDGTTLAKVLRAAIPDIKIVDFSGFGKSVQGADVEMPKCSMGLAKLRNLIKDL